MQNIKQYLDKILPCVNKPGRYVGNELHIIRKSWTDIDVSVALAFPDVYEIGMSHVGMQSLYHVANQPAWIAAERVYVPWPDMEAEMRKAGVPLYSLETYHPVGMFDILGITLQYELQYTNILTLLDLSGIPLHAADRDDSHPLVIAGGPCAFNPEPVASFFDAVALGDGEELLLEIAGVVRNAKRQALSRTALLEELAGLDGVYVPAFYDVGEDGAIPLNAKAPAVIRARTVDTLKPDYYSDKPLVPQIQITHDRFSLEVMRGCTRGCRFCNAGMIYRPLRPRSVEELIEKSKSVIANTGYDEISLVSLSTSDYPELPQLLRQLRNWADESDVSISFPSLRSETFTEELADMAQGLRRSSLTLAPEAGTQRLRDVINKNNTEEDLLRAVQIAFERGWRHVKLYFMIGLPTETEEDLKGIVDLVKKVVQVGKVFGRKDVVVSISPFSPKPHTPFQWEAQISPQEIQSRIDFLRLRLKMRQVKFSWREADVSQLEAVIGRGDRRLAQVIETVWRKGARFDAWSDFFNFRLWVEAFNQYDLKMENYTAARERDTALPWSHLTKGINDTFMRRESEIATAGETTPDCRETTCQGCGLEHMSACRPKFREAVTTFTAPGIDKNVEPDPAGEESVEKIAVRKIRIVYQKSIAARFTGHLDTMRIFYRALRRAKIQIAMSQGFHAHPKMASGPPLSLGLCSVAEYMDLEFKGTPPEDFIAAFNPHLPDGLKVLDSKWFNKKQPALNAAINRQAYKVRWDDDIDKKVLAGEIDSFMQLESYVVPRKKKGRMVDVDIRKFVVELQLQSNHISLILAQTAHGTARVNEVLEAVWRTIAPVTPGTWFIERIGQWIEIDNQKLTPLEIIQDI
ncbi:TIGR03960 family B12-binding radical SAM protein [bacterium]|nr:TIGR03960 family B12-binding radical SAM protein [bacterium]